MANNRLHSDRRYRAAIISFRWAKLCFFKQWTDLNYLTELVTAEAYLRRDRATQHRIRTARFPQIKRLEQFKWSWPQKINQLQVKNLFRLNFIDEKSNVIFLSGVGLGKTHLATALGYQVCLKSHTVLFCSAVDAINNLTAAQSAGRLKQELKKYHKPALETPGSEFVGKGDTYRSPKYEIVSHEKNIPVAKLFYAFPVPSLMNMSMYLDVWDYRMSVSWKSC